MEVVLTLTFSIVVLFFMIFPAMKVTEWLDRQLHIPQSLYTPVMLGMAILFSLGIGLFLRYF